MMQGLARGPIRWHKPAMTTPKLPDDGTPFVLLDDARRGTALSARLYTAPVTIVTTRRVAEIATAFEALRTATRGGLHAAGYLTFEAGYRQEQSFASTGPTDRPLLWFGLFRHCDFIAPQAMADLLPDAASAWIGKPVPTIDRDVYDDAIGRVKALIEAGDIYQANLTFMAKVPMAGHPLALYAGLRARAECGYGGVIHDGRDWYLSCSPELFFAFDGAHIVTKPMKGTAARGANAADDAQAIKTLRDDPKQRAENLMIVDLLRNDLSRVAAPGSVAVPAMFDVETYPTIHQMTSTVTGEMSDNGDAVDVLQTLFPCGSITGAPKIRAMEVIRAVESGARGIYTGAIGRIDAGGGSAAFNVAIRTLDATRGTLGLGSGIVADSRADTEWDECLAKGNFVESQRHFDLIETMGFDPLTGIVRLEAHLERMRASAEVFSFPFDRHAARNELQAATFRLRRPARVRLLLGPRGSMAIAIATIPPPPTDGVAVAIRPLPTSKTDFRLRHKTTDRRFYDDSRRATGAFEVVYHDPKGRLTEGSFTNIFIQDGSTLLTPPLANGLLAGVLRAALLESGSAREADLVVGDLDRPFFIGNSLRGLLPAYKGEL